MISPVTNRVPFNEIISSFDDYYDRNKDIDKKKFPHRPGNLIYNPNFILILNDFVYSFQEISAVEENFPYTSYQEGGNLRPQFTHQFLKEETFTTQNISALLSLVTPSGVGFLRKQSLLAAAKLDPVYTLEHGPAEGIIQIFDRTFKNDVANFKFFSYGANRWYASELDATSGNIVYETIDLVCTNLTRTRDKACYSDSCPVGTYKVGNKCYDNCFLSPNEFTLEADTNTNQEATCIQSCKEKNMFYYATDKKCISKCNDGDYA